MCEIIVESVVPTSLEECLDKVKSLAVQGKTLKLAMAEKTDFTWKSFLYNLKSCTLKTNVNMKRWKKTSANYAGVDIRQHIASTNAKCP